MFYSNADAGVINRVLGSFICAHIVLALGLKVAALG